VESATAGDLPRIWWLTGEHLRLHAVNLRNDREQRPRVRVLRTAQHLLGVADLDDPTEIHHRNSVSDVPGQPEVMGNRNDGETGLVNEFAHQGQNLTPDRRIE